MREERRVRMPDLANAPLLEARVCQYEATPDKNLVIDRHPEAANVWFVGGGSGHGFKLAPALGEHVAQLVLERRQPKARFRLSRSGLIKTRVSYQPRKSSLYDPPLRQDLEKPLVCGFSSIISSSYPPHSPYQLANSSPP
jgi:hypothetical protein